MIKNDHVIEHFFFVTFLVFNHYLKAKLLEPGLFSFGIRSFMHLDLLVVLHTELELPCKPFEDVLLEMVVQIEAPEIRKEVLITGGEPDPQMVEVDPILNCREYDMVSN